MPALSRGRVAAATWEMVAFVTLTAVCVLATSDAARAQKAAPAAPAAANRVTLPSQKLAALDIERQIVGRGDAAEAAHQVADTKQRISHGRASRAAP